MTVVMELLFLLVVSPSLAWGSGGDYILTDYGAKPGADTDSSSAFLRVWNAACNSTGPSTIHVPLGRFLVASPTVFRGSCKASAINFRIDGVLVAPSDFQVLAAFSASPTWLSFEDVVGVSISGGTLDAQGSTLWSCKRSSASNCPNGATGVYIVYVCAGQSLRFTNSKNISLNGLTSLNSQLYHIVFNGCNNVMVQSVKVAASGQSPNTDGIHVQGSTGVTILNTRISTGDDCVSIGPGTTNLWIEHMNCGPGHGISIGSLGKESSEAGVQNVTVKSVVFSGTQNGVRIKSWARPSTSFVRNVLFQNATMFNVQNPIIIDQHYCPGGKNCPNSVSGVRISDVTYENIHGSSATQVGVKLNCSSKYPCTNIKREDVKLTYGNQAARSSCDNVRGASGVIEPLSCL